MTLFFFMHCAKADTIFFYAKCISDPIKTRKKILTLSGNSINICWSVLKTSKFLALWGPRDFQHPGLFELLRLVLGEESCTEW